MRRKSSGTLTQTDVRATDFRQRKEKNWRAWLTAQKKQKRI